MTRSHQALRRLREGNERFASGKGSADAFMRRVRRASTVSSQEPFAIVIGCSDSRVPVEIVFDQDLGDLFGKLLVMGGIYDLETGRIELLDEAGIEPC